MNVLERVKGFWGRQTKNYKVFLIRDALTQLVPISDYWDVFMTRLGALPVDIGLTRGIGNAANVLLALPSAWWTDHVKKMRRLYLFGELLALPTNLIRFLARSWPFCALAAAWDGSTARVTDPASEVISIHSLSNVDRVRGLTLRQTIMSTIGVAAPMISALIVTYFGGLGSADNIRPLFFIQFVIALFLFLFMLTQLRDVTFTRGERRSGVLSHMFGIFKVPGLKMLLFRDCMVSLKDQMGLSFMRIYMVTLKGADQFTLGWRATIATAANIFFSIPAGQLADRFGRKRVAIYTRVFGWVAYFLPIITPIGHPEYFIVAGFFESMRNVLMIGWRAFDQEVVPLDVRGRWNGIRMLITGTIGIIAPIIGGLLYEINPDYTWWIALFLDAFVILPAMVLIPEPKKK